MSKNKARERRTVCILPQVRGNATFIFTFIFQMNSPQTTQNSQKRNGENFRQTFFRAFPYFAVLTAPGCGLFRRFFTTDFTDFTDGRPHEINHGD